MKYWLNLYTWKTWNEFLEAGREVSGFKDSRWRTLQKIKPGDILLCYMTGISRFFAIQEVIGKPFKDETPIWEEMVFPSRLPVKVHMYLEPAYAIPVISLRSHLSYFQNMKSPHSWTGSFRGSPIEIRPADADIIIGSLEDAQANPVYREYDQRKLERKVRGYETKSGTVSIPEDDETEDRYTSAEQTTHEEIQWLLLKLGEEMGLDLWIARNDKISRSPIIIFRVYRNYVRCSRCSLMTPPTGLSNL